MSLRSSPVNVSIDAKHGGTTAGESVTPMWEPATDIEQRMRDSLRAGQQEEYFRILARQDLLLPVSDDDSSGGAESWATWSAEDRTHILAFTTREAMQACLHSHAGAYRAVPFTALSEAWPDPDWWLAINPGLPIEGYLPAWFVSQVATGNAGLPDQPAEAPAPSSSLPSPPTQAANPPMSASGLPVRERPASQDSGQAAQAANPPMSASGLPVRERSSSPEPGSTDASAAYDQSGPGFAGGFGDYQPATSSYDNSGGGDYWDQNSGDQYGYRDAGYDQGGGYTAQEPGADSYYGSQPPSQDAYASYQDTYQESAPFYQEQSDPGPANLPVPVTQSAAFQEWPTEAEVEDELSRAATSGDSGAFLEMLMRSWAYIPLPEDGVDNARPGDPDFRWHTDIIEGEYTVTAFTTANRLATRYGDLRYVKTTFARLTKEWPGGAHSLYVNPGTEVGANMPGPQVTTFVEWAQAKGLLETALAVENQAFGSAPAEQAVVPELMQKVLPHHQVPMILERGYDRVAGFVHRYADVADLATPADLYQGLDLIREGNQFSYEDDSVHVVSWVGHRTELYRVAYGGNSTEEARANNGWIVEPPPFVGNGYASNPDGRRIPEFKVDSVRLPHGARIYQLTAAGQSSEIASFDADRREWIRSEVPAAVPSWGAATDPFNQEQQHA